MQTVSRTALGYRAFVFLATAALSFAALGADETPQAAAPTPLPAPPPALELVTLGSGGPGATGRAASSHVVVVDGVPRVLVDAGPGAFVRLGESGLSIARLDIVLLTHLHADHAGDLPGIVTARAVGSRGPIELRVFGPGGHPASGHGDAAVAAFPSTRRLVDLLFGPQGAFGYLRDFSAPLRLRASDVAGDATHPRVLVDEDGLRITAIAGHHRDAPAVIYRIDHGGRSITFSGDIDASGLPALQRIARDSSLLVFNTVVLDPPASPAVLYTLHTPPAAIGHLAHADAVGALLLAHLSPAVERARAQVEASIAREFSGPVVFATDGLHSVP